MPRYCVFPRKTQAQLVSGVKQWERLLIGGQHEEIARVMRAAKVMGLKTVAVYSDTDAEPCTPAQRHSGSTQGYDGGRILPKYQAVLEAARKTNADAIHLAMVFCRKILLFAACSEANVLFIGPPASAVVMG